MYKDVQRCICIFKYVYIYTLYTQFHCISPNLLNLQSDTPPSVKMQWDPPHFGWRKASENPSPLPNTNDIVHGAPGNIRQKKTNMTPHTGHPAYRGKWWREVQGLRRSNCIIVSFQAKKYRNIGWIPVFYYQWSIKVFIKKWTNQYLTF